ncbi:MAG: S41 family peptidase, partial [Bacteroidota bacterium]
MKYLTYLLFILLPSLLLCQDSISKSSAEALLTEVHDALVYRHPFSQDEVGKEKLQRALEQAEVRLDSALTVSAGDSLSMPDLIVLAAGLQQAIGCGHSFLRPTLSEQQIAARLERQRAIRVLKTANGRYYLRDTLRYDSTMIPQGTEVTGFEDWEIEDILKTLGAFNGFNDEDYRGGQLRYAGLALTWLYQERFGARDSVRLTVMEQGQPKDYWVNLRYKPAAKKVPKKEKHKRSFYLRELPEENAWRMTVRSFGSSAYEHYSFRKLLRESFAKINASGADKLIIDVRNNGGGDIKNVIKLFSYLAEEPFTAVSD